MDTAVFDKAYSNCLEAKKVSARYTWILILASAYFLLLSFDFDKQPERLTFTFLGDVGISKYALLAAGPIVIASLYLLSVLTRIQRDIALAYFLSRADRLKLSRLPGSDATWALVPPSLDSLPDVLNITPTSDRLLAKASFAFRLIYDVTVVLFPAAVLVLVFLEAFQTFRSPWVSALMLICLVPLVFTFLFLTGQYGSMIRAIVQGLSQAIPKSRVLLRIVPSIVATAITIVSMYLVTDPFESPAVAVRMYYSYAPVFGSSARVTLENATRKSITNLEADLTLREGCCVYEVCPWDLRDSLVCQSNEQQHCSLKASVLNPGDSISFHIGYDGELPFDSLVLALELRTTNVLIERPLP